MPTEAAKPSLALRMSRAIFSAFIPLQQVKKCATICGPLADRRPPFIGYDPRGLGKSAWEAREMGLRVEDRIRKTVVFIGSASHGPFHAIGTGFITLRFDGDVGFQHIVTCKHVIDMAPNNLVHIRVNRKDGTAHVIETTKEWWFPHPDRHIDLMVCPTRMPRDQFDIMHLDMGDQTTLSHTGIDRDKIGIGDDVYIPGMYVSRIGDNNNIPILRGGMIAAMPEANILTAYGEHEAYLVETRSIDGLSGSPVFAVPSIIRIEEGTIKPAPTLSFFLIGMLLGHHQVENNTDFIELPPTGRGRRPKKIPILLNTGIGVVLPISAAIEAIDQERLKMERTNKAQDHRRGFVADATKTPPDSDHQGNQEAFNRLVSAASKRRPPSDRT